MKRFLLVPNPMDFFRKSLLKATFDFERKLSSVSLALGTQELRKLQYFEKVGRLRAVTDAKIY